MSDVVPSHAPSSSGNETAFQSRKLTESVYSTEGVGSATKEEVDDQGVPTAIAEDGIPSISLPTGSAQTVGAAEGDGLDPVADDKLGHAVDEEVRAGVTKEDEEGMAGVITPVAARSNTGTTSRSHSHIGADKDSLLPSTSHSASIPPTIRSTQSISGSEYDPEIADIAIIPPPQTSNLAAASSTSLTGSTTSSAADRMRKVLGPPTVPERRSSFASLAVSEGGGDYYTPMGIDDGEREEILADNVPVAAKDDDAEGTAAGGDDSTEKGGLSAPFGFMGLGPADGLAPPLLTNPSAYGLPSGHPGVPVPLATIADGDEEAEHHATANAVSASAQTRSNDLLTPTSPPPTFGNLNNITSRARSNSNRSQGEGGERGANLKAWWKGFKARTGSQSGGRPELNQRALAALAEPNKGKGKESAAGQSVFAIPLEKSLEIASVQISTSGPKGELYVWGYIPVVVAKCGSHLKSTATEVEGTFRVSGSAKRMKELQAIFDGPPKYGKNLEWSKTSFTTHDVATILRRYLTQMPEPIIPYDLYYHFRDMLSNPDADADEVIRVFKALIGRMPKPNQYLLIYVLDLLSVFARKSDVNLMTATNLAMIFQPGIISHTSHDMAPAEHGLSQKVLIFLIEHQDSFMLGMNLDAAQSHLSEPSNESTLSSSSPSPSPGPQSLSPATQSLSAAPPGLPLSPGITASSTSSPVHTSAPVPITVSGDSALDQSAKGPTSTAVLIAGPKPVPTVPRPPPRERPAPGEMLPSDSDSDEPDGGYYVKAGDPTGLLRNKTLTGRQPRKILPSTGLGIALATSPRKRVEAPPPKLIIVDNPQEPMSGYGMAHPTPYKRPVEKKEPVLVIHDNPPFQAGGLARRRTAPTKRGDKPVRTAKERKEHLPARPGKASAPANAEAP